MEAMAASMQQERLKTKAAEGQRNLVPRTDLCIAPSLESRSYRPQSNRKV